MVFSLPSEDIVALGSYIDSAASFEIVKLYTLRRSINRKQIRSSRSHPLRFTFLALMLLVLLDGIEIPAFAWSSYCF
jgi:hypothetical protein